MHLFFGLQLTKEVLAKTDTKNTAFMFLLNIYDYILFNLYLFNF